jgi:hypothetical protein
MAANVSVDVSADGLGTWKEYYGSGGNYENYVEVHFFPNLGVTIDYEYHYKSTVTYDSESESDKEPTTKEG